MGFVGFVGRWRAIAIVAAAWLVATPAQADQLLVDDPLTGPGGPPKQVNGGTFGPGGWTRDSFQAQIVYDLGVPVTHGRITFEMNGINGFDHGVGGSPPCRAIFAAADADGSGDLGVQNIWVWAMDDTVICNGADEPPLRTNRMKLLVRTEVEPAPGEPMTDELDWNPDTFYSWAVEWDDTHATLTRNGVLLLDQVYPSGALAMNMQHVFLGTINRYDAGVREATYRNLQVWDLGDGGGACLQAVSLDPMAGTGDGAVFEAIYSHCEGADTFRIVQIWFGDEVAVEVPHTGGSFENGEFSWDMQTCVPGDDVQLTSELSTLDCAQSSATPMGNLMIVRYAVQFDVDAFGGPRNIFFDAKGGAGDPEPRLGWTQVGTFDVQPGGATMTSGIGGNSGGDGSGTTDTAATGDAATGAGSGLPGFPGGDRGDDGCSCRARSRGGPIELWWLPLLYGARPRRGQKQRSPESPRRPVRDHIPDAATK